jgi:hypothetical protein
MAEIQLADVVVEMADTLVDEFDVIDFLHVWTERCVDLPGVSAAGVAVDRRAGRVAGGGRLLRTDPAAELFQLQTDQGPGVDRCRTGRPVSVAGRKPLLISRQVLGNTVRSSQPQLIMERATSGNTRCRVSTVPHSMTVSPSGCRVRNGEVERWP